MCVTILKRRECKKSMPQDNFLILLQDIGSHKVYESMTFKSKFISMLSICGVINVVVKSGSKQTLIHCCMIALHAHEFPSRKRRKGESSITAVPLMWDFESEHHMSMRKRVHPLTQDQMSIVWKHCLLLSTHKMMAATVTRIVHGSANTDD